MIYADHAATTQLFPEALAAMMPYLQGDFGNASQPYGFARAAKKALKAARVTIAECLHADPDEILFTSGGTESDNWALKGIMRTPGDRRALLTSQIEHHAVLRTAEAVEAMGYPVSYLPVNEDGRLLPDTLKQAISNETQLVSIMMANNEIGTLQPIRELAELAHAAGARFHTDAVQAVGHLPVDVQTLGVDLLSASAHKFNGPKGIGFLYVKRGCPLGPEMHGGAQEGGLRAGTENIASIVGMACALKKNCEQMAQNQAILAELEAALMHQLASSGLRFRRNGSLEHHLPGIVSLSFEGAEGEMLLHRLDLKGISVSTGSACDSQKTQISHVLAALKLPLAYARGTLRISLGPENTMDDLSAIVRALSSILQPKVR